MYYKNTIKPSLDFIFALLFLLIVSPIFILVTLILLFANKSNPFFIQPRPGRNGKVFKIIKFKTMNDRKDMDGNLLSDDKRLTRIGWLIRKTSVDEWPQLLNVIKGDMSIVGPRPLLIEYLPLYDDFQKRRHEVKPGITGWAQVNGRNAISWEEKFWYDIFYVDNISIMLDIKIILLTVKKVLWSADVNQSESITMEKFNGN